MNSVQNNKILVAGKPQAQEVVGNALESRFNLIYCDNFDHAKRLLAEPVDLIVCTVLFNGSRMFDLLRYAKENRATRSIPFVAVRAVQGALPLHEVSAATAAAKLLGAEEFADLHGWISDLGEQPAFEKLRATIGRLL